MPKTPTDSTRNKSGQFGPGNKAAKKPPTVKVGNPTFEQLVDIAGAADKHLYLTAMLMDDTDQAVEEIRERFPPAVVARIEHIVRQSKIADQIIDLHLGALAESLAGPEGKGRGADLLSLLEGLRHPPIATDPPADPD